MRCDVAVIGAGITGALIADELVAHGHDVVVVDQRDAGWGSASASTALLQYEIDTHMTELRDRFGEDDAALAYKACAEAIPMLQERARSFRDVEFARMSSLYYASKRGHRKRLEQEFALRQKHGFDVAWLQPDDIEQRFGFRAPGAILSAVHGCSTVPPVSAIEVGARDVVLRTPEGARLVARHLVVAGGYASMKLLSQRVANIRSSYAFITDPVDASTLGALRGTMVWESARPYLYLRTTADGRVLIGGEDDAVDITVKRDALVGRKTAKLRDKVSALFPHLSLQPAFAWAGSFAETKDGLPFFAAHAQHGPRVLFAMAYGGNGITYSMLGAGLLRATIERRKHPLARLFGFERLER